MSTRSYARWLEVDEEEFFDGPPFSDDEATNTIHEQIESSDSDTGSEPDGIDLRDFIWDQDFYGITSSAYYLGEDETMWFKNQTSLRKSPPTFSGQAGPRAGARSRMTPLDCFNLFFDDNVIDLITKSTNERIKNVQLKYAKPTDAKFTTEIEIRALLGILYLSGSLKAYKDNFLQLFETSKGTGMEAIYLTMSSQRYKFLMKNIRFDDPATNAERIKEDKLAPIRELFELILNNFQTHYVPSAELNLKKRLIPFDGRCNFCLHVPKKAKQGIRVFALVDCNQPYTVNMEIYLGRNPGPYQVNYEKWTIATRVTLPIHGEYRNVTMNNWFSSLMTVEKLLLKKTTVVATIKKNLKEIPTEFRQCKNKIAKTSQFGYHDIATLVQYISQEGQFNLLISSLHSLGNIDESTGDERMPEIITFYKRTKRGVDLVEKMCATYDVSRPSRRWPLTIFFNMMNIAAINALCVYSTNMTMDKICRRDFLTELALNMMKPLALRRLNSESVPKALKFKLAQFVDAPFEPEAEPERPVIKAPEVPPPELRKPNEPLSGRRGIRGRCYLCTRKRKRESRISCKVCRNYVCNDHYEYLCAQCFDNKRKR